MNYKLIYDALIHKAQNRTKPDGYVESHHIVPKCLGGSDTSKNLVCLTAREHCLAHLLLARIYGGKLWRAAFLMSGKFKLTSKAYAVAREKNRQIMSEFMKGKNLGEKSGMFGKGHLQLGNKNPNFKGPVIANNIKTGTSVTFVGQKEMHNLGFSDSAVSQCLNGKRKTHKQHTFVRA